MATYLAEWTGCYPNLCHGEWKLFKDGVDISDKIPELYRHRPMNTEGEYETWTFEDWVEVFESYESGLPCAEWVDENKDWIGKIGDQSDFEKIFEAFQAEDWRRMSCGGCI